MAPAQAPKGKRLIMFFGTECTHCHEMDPVVERLESDIDRKIDRLEVWHDATNAQFLDECDKGGCGGVPFFFNEETGQGLCGEQPYDRLKEWAMGKKR